METSAKSSLQNESTLIDVPTEVDKCNRLKRKNLTVLYSDVNIYEEWTKEKCVLGILLPFCNIYVASWKKGLQNREENIVRKCLYRHAIAESKFV
jgi:hypothetical protein